MRKILASLLVVISFIFFVVRHEWLSHAQHIKEQALKEQNQQQLDQQQSGPFYPWNAIDPLKPFSEPFRYGGPAENPIPFNYDED